MRSDMRLALLLGITLFWVAGSIPQVSQAPARGVAYAAAAPDFFSISAQPVTTPTLTLPALVNPTAAVPLTATVATTATATLEVTATATLSGPPPPTVSVPVVNNDVPLQLNPFDAGFLFSSPRPPMGPFSWACFALMIVLLGGSGYFYAVKRPQWKRTNTVLYRAANRWSQPGLWLAIVGLLLILFRLIGLDFFNLRFWLYLWFLVLIGIAAWFFYWYRTAYPKELDKFQKTQRARQYMPGGAVKTPARQPDRTAPKPVPQPRAAQKPSGSVTTPAAKSSSPGKPSGDRKRGKGK